MAASSDVGDSVGDSVGGGAAIHWRLGAAGEPNRISKCLDEDAGHTGWTSLTGRAKKRRRWGRPGRGRAQETRSGSGR